MLPFALTLSLLSPAVHAIQQGPSAPDVFASLTYEEARAQAAKEGKLLVLDAMTSWCGPCKRMDVTTWVDPALVLWMETHTVAIQLDMDEHTALKTELTIAAFPTIIAFDADGEADRLVGYRDAAAMSAWLELVRSGKTELERIVAEIDAQAWDGSVESLRRRQRYAQELMYLKGYEPARELLLGAWAAAPAAGFPRTNLRSLLRDLASADADSAAAITRLRQETLSGASAALLAADSSVLSDWVDLSVALSDVRGLDAWVLGRNASHDADTARLFGRILYPVLLNAGRWRSAGIALANPIQQFERSGSALAKFDAPQTQKKGGVIMAMPMIGAGAKKSADSGETAVLIRAQFRWDASRAYGTLLAAGRMDEAVALADLTLRYEDSAKARIALVSRALEADQASTRRLEHMRWLDEATSAPSQSLK
ncbi:MAG: thiol-disulfide isomerase/thioredoxin [Planctomycetota bacterium]|jgi:thiol-disulfide isomerase/thioredoxin